MKYVLSRYNHDISWVPKYTNDVVLYDRSEKPVEGSIVVPNIGSDIYDKLTYIIDNYDNLPEVALYSKANLFKYITESEFEKVKDNKVFTPLLTKNHQTRREGNIDICFYANNIYWEINNFWYLNPHSPKSAETAKEVAQLVGIAGLSYVPFAPGSNYILPKENILKHPKSFYEKLRSYLEWAVYPGEAQIIERGLYTIWS